MRPLAVAMKFVVPVPVTNTGELTPLTVMLAAVTVTGLAAVPMPAAYGGSDAVGLQQGSRRKHDFAGAGVQ